jgi:acetyl esterase/lipase
MDVAGAPAVADGMEALRQIRARAAEYDFDPTKIVAIGFSAGAHVAAHMMLNGDAAMRPNFTALIYGAPFGGSPGNPAEAFPRIPASTDPDALPPFFMAMAQNDTLVGDTTREFYDAVFAAGYRPEVHLYLNGGHGFGMNSSNNTSRHFITQFYWWMESLGLTRKPGDPDRAARPPGAGRGGRGGGRGAPGS